MRNATYNLRAEVEAPSRKCRAEQLLTIEPLPGLPQPPLKPFAEEGATNSHGEYKWWLHVKLSKTKRGSMIYPWPFAPRIENLMVVTKPDAPLLVSYWHMTKFNGWPQPWPHFRADIGYLIRTPITGERTTFIVWCLQPTPVDRGTWQFDPIPKEIYDAFA